MRSQGFESQTSGRPIVVAVVALVLALALIAWIAALPASWSAAGPWLALAGGTLAGLAIGLSLRSKPREKELLAAVLREIPDGVFLLQGEEIVGSNPIAERILRSSPAARRAVLDSIARAIPTRISLATPQREYHYLLNAHSVELPFADHVVVAQDATVARESQHARASFLGTLSHEVKTPITSITMAIRLLHRGVEQIPNPVHRSLVNTCAEDLERLKNLLDDLLAVTRSDTLGEALDTQRVDLSKLMRHSVQNHRAMAIERGVELASSQNESLKGMLIPLDPTKVTWVISSLLLHAIARTPSGERVEISLNPALSAAGQPVDPSAGFDWLVLRVRSGAPGSGSDSGVSEAIFEKSHPDYDIRSAKSGNPKFGLAIAREIASAHGGRIWATGSEVCVTLPVRGIPQQLSPGLVVKPDSAAARQSEKSESHQQSS